MIDEIQSRQHAKILAMNQKFVHWLSPLDAQGLTELLSVASYGKQIDDAAGVLIGYGHDVDYDHKNLQWLRARFDAFFYIDRVIIGAKSHGQGYGRLLYADFEQEALRRVYPRLVCEVNTKPNNPGSHKFHLQQGFTAIGDEDYPAHGASLRYYEKRISEG